MHAHTHACTYARAYTDKIIYTKLLFNIHKKHGHLTLIVCIPNYYIFTVVSCELQRFVEHFLAHATVCISKFSFFVNLFEGGNGSSLYLYLNTAC